MPLTDNRAAGLASCIVIPCFNHGAMIARVLARLRPFGLHCFIIDDGSDAPTRDTLEHLCAGRSDVTLLRLAENQGKGQAVLTGLAAAAAGGYTHALQVDADGQHQLEDIPLLLRAAAGAPDKLISGRPLYDRSVPRARLYGRYITHLWVWIETLSLSLQDSMCGFRVYPIAATLALARRVRLGKRMDFDTEVMVRLYWQGNESLFVPTRVIYPADGLSHFDGLRDNCRISWMHTRLFFGMLPRIPTLLLRNRRRRRPRRHWSGMAERHGAPGMRFMLAAYRHGGRRLFNALLYPVIGYFWLTGRVQRRASEQYLQRVKQTAALKGIELPRPLSSFRHFMRFGDAMLDKLAGWQGDIRLGEQIDFAAQSPAQPDIDRQRGLLILASHLGDIEVCRALAQGSGRVKINALVFSAHAQRFQALLSQVNPDAGINLIPVTDIGPDTAILLRQKLDLGEWVAIVGDRTPVQAQQRGAGRRVVWSDFLGRPAPFPQGPFVLAAALRCPVALMFALKEQGKLRIYYEHFADRLELPRQQRQQALQQTVDRYAGRLQHYCLRSPLDWFNFFDFWRLPDEQAPPPEA
ncbi:glycosyltransferase family 2 protein [Acerihabitans arboris]|uniref:Glycosyltransferase n=1 Tax=Acerihabitans arboris TaxID=2691583 RepID=A0A845SRY6_9GAMM|nr:glycosyltransferase family 2 protein [Acerihabitans arboris]NDL65626.1 glycosyltransferase [Acerihabitans arboris]